MEYQEAQQVVLTSWAAVDRSDGAGAEMHFAPDAAYVTPGMSLRGRAEIAAVYEARAAAGPVVSRHVVVNLLLATDATGRPEARYTVLNFSGAGTPPLQTAPPSTIVDVCDAFAWSGDAWQIADRRVETVFIAADNRSIMLRGSTSVE